MAVTFRKQAVKFLQRVTTQDQLSRFRINLDNYLLRSKKKVSLHLYPFTELNLQKNFISPERRYFGRVL